MVYPLDKKIWFMYCKIFERKTGKIIKYQISGLRFWKNGFQLMVVMLMEYD